MYGPEAALYSSGTPGVKPGGGVPLTVMLTVGAVGMNRRREYTKQSLTETIFMWSGVGLIFFSLPKF